MIFDNNLKIADNQAITATVNTDAVYLGNKNVAQGKEVPFAIVVDETFNNLTSLTIKTVVCPDTTFGSNKVTLDERTHVLAKLVENAILPPKHLPDGAKGYLRLEITVTGTAPTKGRITAGVVDAVGAYYADL